MSTNLHMRTGSATHRGVYRENNEDSMIVAGTLCVVADGMGGHEAGEVASRLCVRQLAYSSFFTLPGGMSPEEQEDYERRVHDENKGKSNRRKTSELNNEILRTLERLRSLIGEANDQIKGALSKAGGTTVTGVPPLRDGNAAR